MSKTGYKCSMNNRIEEIKATLKQLDEWADVLDPANPIEGQQLDKVLTDMESLEAELEVEMERAHRAKFKLIQGGKR